MVYVLYVRMPSVRKTTRATVIDLTKTVDTNLMCIYALSEPGNFLLPCEENCSPTRSHTPILEV